MATFTVEPSSTVLELHQSLPPAELAAAAFLARYRGRTLESYRHDLRSFFAWAEGVGLEVLSANRPQLELYVRHLEGTGLAPSTIDRRVSTVCGFYRFAHVDGVIASNPAQYVRRPQVHPNRARSLDRGALASFLLAAERCDQANAALAVLPKPTSARPYSWHAGCLTAMGSTGASSSLPMTVCSPTCW